MTESLGRVLEVVGLPEGVDDELLALYFENKRRSGGGPLVSVDKSEDRALLVFEEAEAAARVLSKEHHVIHNVELSVRKPATKDPCRFLLKGINPSTSIEMIELYVENLLNLNVPEYTLLRSPDNKLILIQLSHPLSQDIQKLSERISKRLLSGAVVTLEEVTETDAVLLDNVNSGTTADLISLYFESQRGGSQRVKEVVMLSEGSAKVTFVCFESVNLILNRPHKLEDADLVIKPFFDFLQPTEISPSPLRLPLPLPDPQPNIHDIPDHPPMEQDEAPLQIISRSPAAHNTNSLPPLALSPETSIDTAEVMEESQTEEVQITTETIAMADLTKLSLFQNGTLQRDTEKSHPEYNMAISIDGVHVTGPKRAEMDQIKSTILEFFSSMVEITFTLEQTQAQFLAQKDVIDKLAQTINQSETLYTVSDCTVLVMSLSEDSAKQTCRFLKSQVSSFSVQVEPDNESMLYCREWQEFCQSLGFVKVSQRGRNLDVVTLKGLEGEKQAAILTFLTTPIEREAFIPMEPGRLQYIQTHSHQLLADMTEVSIFPVEGVGACGLKIHGHPTACQIAEELLQGLVSDICTKTITVNVPGITRFTQTDECKKMFNEMETKFQVCICPELVPWEPPINKNMADCAWKILADKNFIVRSTPDDLRHIEANTTLLNEAKMIVSAIEERPPEPIVVDELEDMDNVDLYSADDPGSTTGQESEAGLISDLTDSENPSIQGASSLASNLEEEAQLSLAIQYSMESSLWSMEDEDAQLQKALELSRKMIQEEAISHQEMLTLEEPAKRSLKDTIQSANMLKLVVFASYTSDLIRVDIAFGKKVTQRQDEQKLEHRCLKYLSEFHKTCLDVIRRNHAVKIDIIGTIISVSGFKSYVEEALSDVKLLLEKMSNTVSDKEILKTVRWVQHDSTLQQKTPYPPDLTVLLDNAWRMRLRTLDVLLDSQQHIINIEKMEVHNIASGAVLKISREPFIPEDNTQEDFPEEDYSILSSLPEATKVDEESDEFQIVVKNFYETIQQYHSKIRIVKVERVMNKLLYSQYKLKKASVKQAAAYPEVERTLYHGTSESSVKEICVHGFNRSFCGKNATVFGQGVYFAVNAALSVSDQYSPPNVDGHKYIFVAKVLTGDYTLGNHSMKTAPLKETGDIPLRYDSVTDDINKPTLFVIFNDTQAIPEYLITCQHIYGH